MCEIPGKMALQSGRRKMTFQAGLGPCALTRYTVVKGFLLLDLKIAQSPLSMRAVYVPARPLP